MVTPMRGVRKKEVFVVLHNVRSVHNVGSIFRTTDAAGVYKIFLTGYTPTPADRFGRTRRDLAKTALGAEKSVLWEYVKNISTLVSRLKKEKVTIVALEQAENSVDYKKIKPRLPFALILGNEVRGISKSILKKCDLVCEIPMRGQKESLNVSVALGIALFRILDI